MFNAKQSMLNQSTNHRQDLHFAKKKIVFGNKTTLYSFLFLELESSIKFHRDFYFIEFEIYDMKKGGNHNGTTLSTDYEQQKGGR